MADRDDPSDDDLIARIAKGDRDAFAALYRRRRPDVYRFAVHMTGSHAAAEDVVQDVFIAVIDHAGRYARGRSTVVLWLLGIARNYVRRAARAGQRTVPLGDAGVRSDAASLLVDADPLPALAHRQDVAAVRRALAELPIKYREAIVLCDVREMSYADAAGVLRCAVGTIRSRLHRGRALLADRLRQSESQVRTPATGLIV